MTWDVQAEVVPSASRTSTHSVLVSLLFRICTSLSRRVFPNVFGNLAWFLNSPRIHSQTPVRIILTRWFQSGGLHLAHIVLLQKLSPGNTAFVGST